MTTASTIHSGGVSVPFTYTFEEYEESHIIAHRRQIRLASAPRDRNASDPPPKRVPFPRAFASIVIVAVLIAVVEFCDSLPGFLARRPGEAFGLKLFAPLVFFYITFSFIAAINNRAKLLGRKLSRTPAEKRMTRNAILSPFLAMFFLGSFFLKAINTGTVDDALHELSILVIPWVAIFAWSLIVGAESRGTKRNVLRKTWDNSPHLHVEKRITINLQGFSLTDAQACYQLNWELLTGEEGDRIFLLIASGIFYMVPKRILSFEQAEFLRDRLGLRPAVSHTGGFPVLPVH